MSDHMLKVIEVLAESEKSWEDAANLAIQNASRSIHGIQSIYIKEFEAKVEENRIVKYRVNAKITFKLD
ncbi:dodecin family protein [Guyparkeria sp. 1SP6A2]|nr:dodecin family protein [Guyparkeria sp. 1SP6A2]